MGGAHRSRSRLFTLALAVALAALAGGLNSIAASAAPAHQGKSGQGHKKKPLNCKSLLGQNTLTTEIAKETGIGPQFSDETIVERKVVYSPKLPKSSQCFTDWGGDDYTGNGPDFGVADGTLPPPTFWAVTEGITVHQFNKIYDAYDDESGGLPETGGGNLGKQGKVSLLGAPPGTHAFLLTLDEQSFEFRKDYPTDYGIYALSKGKNGKPGNMFELWAWPMQLEPDPATGLPGEKGIVTSLLNAHAF